MDATRLCPRCDTGLADYDVHGTTVDFCTRCHGIWCDGGELERLLRGDLGDLHFAGESEVQLRCPSCATTMSLNRVPSGEATRLAECPHCRGFWLDAGALERLRSRRFATPPSGGGPTPDSSPRPTSFHRMRFDSPLTKRLALPVAFAIAFLLNMTEARILIYPFQVAVHELGHAVAAWLSGRIAVPLPMAVTFWGPQSTLVAIAVLCGLLAASVVAVRARKIFWSGAVACVLALHIYLAWILSSDASEMWAIYSGIAGELLLSALLLIGFYHPAPDRIRWDFWRFVLLVPAACTLTASLILWSRAQTDPSLLPLGSALASTNDGTGDLERLIHHYGWTQKQLLTTYGAIATACLLAVVTQFGVGLLSSGKRAS